jgi:hypothetical protein
MSFVPTPISVQQPITINDEAVSSADNDGTLKTPRKTYGMKRMAEEDLGKDSSKKRPKVLLSSFCYRILFKLHLLFIIIRERRTLYLSYANLL